MTLQIEEGKFYATRDGRKAGPACSYDEGGGNYRWTVPVHGLTSDDGYFVYTDDGRYSVLWSDAHLDLVAEWVDEPAKEALELLTPTAQVKNEPGWKYDAGKPRLDLIAPEFLTGTADILAFGAEKYGERNWEAGMSWSRPFAALMRHMWAWWAGEEKDAETGKSHLWHAACCLMFLIAFEARNTGKDDRAKISS